MMNYSETESRRFGCSVFRGHIEQVDVPALLEEMEAKDVELGIIRLPAEKQYQLSALGQAQVPYLVADTLVYYNTLLQRDSLNQLKNKDLVFVRCSHEHELIIDKLIAEIFVDYTTHYYSNPYLDKKLIIQGYQEWARAYVASEGEGKISWLVQKEGQFVAFISCAFHFPEAEIILNGVLPSLSGQGIYGDMVRFVQAYFRERQYDHLKISTQVQNYAVQKVWAREGFYLNKAFITIHLNRFLLKNKSNDSFQ